MHRSAAILIAMLCCRLSFCHQLATAGPDATWSTGGDIYIAQSFGHEWHCDVGSSQCRRAEEPATGISGFTFLGIELWALCATCACVVLALGRSPRRWSYRVCVGILTIGWLAFAADVAELATPTFASWGIATCPVAVALLPCVRPKAPPIPAATMRVPGERVLNVV